MSTYNIGIILRELRKKKHFSQKQLAEGICSIEYISKIENGKKTPSSEIISRLFHRLGENPGLFFMNLSSVDNELFTEHRFELEKLLGASEFAEAEAYIFSLEKEYSFYSSGEPLQYIMGKRSHILANLYKKFDEAYDLALHAILLTKPEFTLDTKEQYEFYSINELWAFLYMAAALYWKERDCQLGDGIDLPIDLASFVLSHLDKGYLHPSMIGTLYASAAFYLGKFLCSADKLEESLTVSRRGLQFITQYYNQILELLGKIVLNQAFCMLDNHERDALISSEFSVPHTPCDASSDDMQDLHLFDSAAEPEILYEIGKNLLLLSANRETLHRYLDFPYEIYEIFMRGLKLKQ